LIETLSDSAFAIGAMGVLLFGSAFFSSAETAVFNLSLSDLRRGRARTMRRLDALLQDRKGLLITVLIGNLVVNVLYFNLGVLVTSRLAAAGATVAAVATPALVLMLIVILGEITPKTIAVTWPGPVARFAAAPLWWLRRVLWLPQLVLSAVAGAVARVALGSREEEGDVDPEELGGLLALAASEGHLEPDEADALQRVLALHETTVKDVMVPRVDAVMFPFLDGDSDGSARGRFLEVVAEHRLNKIPVYVDSPDTISGFLDAKEVLGRPDASLPELVHPVAFVPETTAVSEVLGRFQRDRVRMMIVVDEYGGTEGLLTHEDLVEAVLGDLTDETDTDQRVVEEEPGQWLVDASMGLRGLAQFVDVSPTNMGVRSLGGLVTALLGRLPQVGDSVRAGRLMLDVVSLRRRRPDRIRVRALRTAAVPRSVVP